MNLEETIEQFKEQAATLRMARDYGCDECAAEYEQVAEWLEELQQRRGRATELAICREHEEAKHPKTNGDKIRAMTDEDLEEFLDTATTCCSDGDSCDKCPLDSVGKHCNIFTIEKWLMQEVSEDADN